jgi:hypothetical protein
VSRRDFTAAVDGTVTTWATDFTQDPKFECAAEARMVKARSCSGGTVDGMKRRADEQTGNESNGLR